MVTGDAENHQLNFRLCRRTMMLDSFRDEPAIKYEIEKKKYTGVVFVKNSSMIKLE